MKIVSIVKPIAIVLTAIGITCAIATPALGGQLHSDRGFTWNYGIDNFTDGSGGSAYEYKGLAMTETDDRIIFAISGGLNYNEESNKKFTHGDLILNFSGGNVTAASEAESLLGVKFAPKNDTVFEVGLYKDVRVGDINDFANINHGGYYGSLKQYYNAGFNRPDTYGSDLATRDETYEYFYGETVANNPTKNNTPLLNGIQSGIWIADIAMLDFATLKGEYGLDFENFNAVGSDTFGFAIEKSAFQDVLPTGMNPFMAHILLECGNDGVALAGETDLSIPEPSMILGLGAIALGFCLNSKFKIHSSKNGEGSAV